MAEMNAPRVSVVMSVFDGAAVLERTIDSVLSQEGVEFEFLVVDDGSRDASPRLLGELARRDARLRVLTQANAGLTRALARACGEARGEYIARQDAGDVSLPGRLREQVGFLDRHPDAVMTACGVRFAGPARERLYEIVRPQLELDQGLRATQLRSLRGPPHHGAAMFRRNAYQAAGGYRLPFVMAQDIDLWLRLCELGPCLGTPEVRYEASVHAGSISSRRRGEQMRLGQLALDCARARREGRPEAELLAAFPPPPLHRDARTSRAERARFHYFVACCLRGHDPEAAQRYLRMALWDNPFHLKAWLRCLPGAR